MWMKWNEENDSLWDWGRYKLVTIISLILDVYWAVLQLYDEKSIVSSPDSSIKFCIASLIHAEKRWSSRYFMLAGRHLEFRPVQLQSRSSPSVCFPCVFISHLIGCHTIFMSKSNWAVEGLYICHETTSGKAIHECSAKTTVAVRRTLQQNMNKLME